MITTDDHTEHDGTELYPPTSVGGTGDYPVTPCYGVEIAIKQLWDFNCSPHGFDFRPSEWRDRLLQLGFTEDQLMEHYPWKPESKP